jgi:hypothetical protein
MNSVLFCSLSLTDRANREAKTAEGQGAEGGGEEMVVETEG